jgi:hypothetical protein
MLGFRIDADATAAAAFLAGQLHDLGKRRNRVQAVVADVVRADRRDALLRAQRADLGEVEILGEPSGDLHAVHALGGAAVGERGVIGDVGGTGDLVLMAHDQYAVTGGDEVRLDEVGALRDGEAIGLQRVFRAVAAGTAMGDDDRLPRRCVGDAVG